MYFYWFMRQSFYFCLNFYVLSWYMRNISGVDFILCLYTFQLSTSSIWNMIIGLFRLHWYNYSFCRDSVFRTDFYFFPWSITFFQFYLGLRCYNLNIRGLLYQTSYISVLDLLKYPFYPFGCVESDRLVYFPVLS